MASLRLSVALGDYDRTRPLIDGSAPIDGVEPVFMTLPAGEIFQRAFRHAEFDVCELSLSSHAIREALGTGEYVGVPIFTSRAFRHSAIYVRTDRGIDRPADLKSRRIGTSDYQTTAAVYIRALLQEEYAVAPEDVLWVLGGMEHPGEAEQMAITLPQNLRTERCPGTATLSGMLERGEIDAIMGPVAPSCHTRRCPNVGRLVADPAAAAEDYFRRTRIFPIMHIVGVRRVLADQHRWLPMACFKAFQASQALALARLRQTAVRQVMLPFLEEQLDAALELMGGDFWANGVAANRAILDHFLANHHRQGLSVRRLDPDALFHSATLGT